MTPPTSQNLKHLEGKYKKEIIEKLNDQFGINNIPGELFMRGNEKIFLFQKWLHKIIETALFKQ